MVLCLTLPVPTAAWSRWLEAGWVLIVALTGFVSAVLLPAAIWQAVRYRSSWAYLRLALVLGGLVVAALVWLAGDRPVVSDVSLRDRLIIMVKSTVLRVGSPLLLGEETAARGWQVGAAVLVLALVAALVIRDWRGASPAWVLSGLVWIVLGVQSVPAASILALLQPFYSERYFAVMTAMCMLVMLRAAALDPVVWIRAVAAVALVLTLPGLVRGYSLPASVPYSPAERLELQRCAMSHDILCPLPVRPQGWIRPI